MGKGRCHNRGMRELMLFHERCLVQTRALAWRCANSNANSKCTRQRPPLLSGVWCPQVTSDSSAWKPVGLLGSHHGHSRLGYGHSKLEHGHYTSGCGPVDHVHDPTRKNMRFCLSFCFLLTLPRHCQDTDKARSRRSRQTDLT